MQGSMQQRSPGSWRIKAYAGRDPVTGAKRYAQRTVRGTKRDAQTELAKLVSEVAGGRFADAKGTTFDALFKRWLELKAHQVDPRTHDGYRYMIERYLSPAIGDMKISRMRTVDLDHLYANLVKTGGHGGKPLSPATVRHCHVVMRQALAQAKRWGLLALNPAEDASPPRQIRKEIEPPSSEDVLQLLKGAMKEDPDFGVYLRLLAATGCRRGEALALRWRDLQVDGDGRGVLTVARAIGQSSSGTAMKDTKTHQGRRLVLDSGTVRVLEDHRQRWEERAKLAGTKIDRGSLLFSNELDASVPWRPDVATNRFNKLCKELGVEGVRLHDFRHYVATSLGAAGTPIATISSRLGHRDRATTLNIYSHTLPALDHQAADVIGDLLDAEVTPTSRP